MVEEVTVIGTQATGAIMTDRPLDVIGALQEAGHRTGTEAGEAAHGVSAAALWATVTDEVLYAAVHLLQRNLGPVAAFVMGHDRRNADQFPQAGVHLDPDPDQGPSRGPDPSPHQGRGLDPLLIRPPQRGQARRNQDRDRLPAALMGRRAWSPTEMLLPILVARSECGWGIRSRHLCGFISFSNFLDLVKC